MYNELKQPIYSDIQDKRIDNAADRISSAYKGYQTRKDIRDRVLKLASKEKAAATKIQSAVRNRTAKRDMMKQRQLVDEGKLRDIQEGQRQLEAAKADKAKKEDIAATQLQSISRRIKAQGDISKIKKAKDTIAATTKRLLTEKVKSFYGPMAKKSYITNKDTVGQPLVVSKKLKLVSKKRHDAAVFGYETRQAFLDLADQYKDVMTKGRK
jgi:hypothetical protein